MGSSAVDLSAVDVSSIPAAVSSTATLMAVAASETPVTFDSSVSFNSAIQQQSLINPIETPNLRARVQHARYYASPARFNFISGLTGPLPGTFNFRSSILNPTGVSSESMGISPETTGVS